ncbi:hypothetical protein INR49_009622 [Caranx melampygus]|nr:hypothetical protein INR49_009622 [Caranx melampygus]
MAEEVLLPSSGKVGSYIKNFYNKTVVSRNGTGLSEETLTVMYSLTVSVFAIGGLLGSLIVGMLVTRFGRAAHNPLPALLVPRRPLEGTSIMPPPCPSEVNWKGTVVNTTVLVFIAGSLMGFSRICGSPEMVIFGRFITGIHSGISLSVIPMYLGEIAPKNLRGFLGLVPSIFIGNGVFVAQILGLHELLGKEEYWPLFLSVVVIPTFIQLMLLPWFPESPRYLLIEKHNVHATITALKWYRAKCNIQAEIEEMQEEQRSLSSVETLSVWKLLMDDSVRWQVLTVVVINIGMQLSGIDAIWFYTNDIFENAGIPVPEIQYTTAGTGVIEIIAGLIGCFTIEKLGRRPLMIGGFAMMGICSAGITCALILQSFPGRRQVEVMEEKEGQMNASQMLTGGNSCARSLIIHALSQCLLCGWHYRRLLYRPRITSQKTQEHTHYFYKFQTIDMYSQEKYEWSHTRGFPSWSQQSCLNSPTARRLHRRRITQLAVQLYCGLRLPFPTGESDLYRLQEELYLKRSMGSYCYLVFATICLSVATYVYIMMPETKNKTFMEISRMFSKKEAVLETQGLIHVDQLKLKKMNGYGGMEHTSLEFDSSSSVP